MEVDYHHPVEEERPVEETEIEITLEEEILEPVPSQTV